MTIQGSGMSSALRMYNNYTTRGNNNSQSETAELQENQEFKQQVAIEGTEPPDGKGVPRGKPPAGEGGMRGAKGAGGPPPKPPMESTDEDETSETATLLEEQDLIETLLDLTAYSGSEEDEDSTDDILGLSTLEDLLQLTASSDDAISEELQSIMLKRFEDAYQSVQPAEMNGPGGPGKAGGPPPQVAESSEDDEYYEDLYEEEVKNTFVKNFEAAYLNASRDYSTVSSYFKAVS